MKNLIFCDETLVKQFYPHYFVAVDDNDNNVYISEVCYRMNQEYGY